MALKKAVKMQLIKENPMLLVDMPRGGKKHKMRILSQQEIAILVEASHNFYYWPVVCMALYTGMRRGEILALRWDDLDLDARLINVKQSMQRILGKGIMFKEPKTEAGTRTIEITPTVVTMLRRIRKEQLEHRVAYGPDYQGQGLVFCQVNGKPLDPHRLSRRFHRLVVSLGLNGFRFHDLRHTHASYMLALGTPLPTLQERLGHGDLASTIIYTHGVPGKQREAADRFEITFGRNPADPVH
jgi:integrase